MTEIWREYIKNIERGREKRKDFQLTVVIPIVLYNGKTSWTAQKSYREYLDQKEYSELLKLENIRRNFDKTSLKLELDYKMMESKLAGSLLTNKINEFLYYTSNQLTVYIGMCKFGNTNIEVCAMVHQHFRRQRIFSRLFQLIKEECINRGKKQLLLLSNRSSSSRKGFIKTIGVVFKNAEYKMNLRNESSFDMSESKVLLRKAKNSDTKEIESQNNIYFGDESRSDQIIEDESTDNRLLPEEEKKKGYIIYIAEVFDVVIGKVHIFISDKTAGIYGLGVLPKYRRKGFGRKILTGAVKKLHDRDCKEIMLVVSTQNK